MTLTLSEPFSSEEFVNAHIQSGSALGKLIGDNPNEWANYGIEKRDLQVAIRSDDWQSLPFNPYRAPVLFSEAFDEIERCYSYYRELRELREKAVRALYEIEFSINQQIKREFANYREHKSKKNRATIDISSIERNIYQTLKHMYDSNKYIDDILHSNEYINARNEYAIRIAQIGERGGDEAAHDLSEIAAARETFVIKEAQTRARAARFATEISQERIAQEVRNLKAVEVQSNETSDEYEEVIKSLQKGRQFLRKMVEPGGELDFSGDTKLLFEIMQLDLKNALQKLFYSSTSLPYIFPNIQFSTMDELRMEGNIFELMEWIRRVLHHIKSFREASHQAEFAYCLGDIGREQYINGIQGFEFNLGAEIFGADFVRTEGIGFVAKSRDSLPINLTIQPPSQKIRIPADWVDDKGGEEISYKIDRMKYSILSSIDSGYPPNIEGGTVVNLDPTTGKWYLSVLGEGRDALHTLKDIVLVIRATVQ